MENQLPSLNASYITYINFYSTGFDKSVIRHVDLLWITISKLYNNFELFKYMPNLKITAVGIIKKNNSKYFSEEIKYIDN